MRYRRMPIEVESPEELGYGTIANNLAESSFSDLRLADLRHRRRRRRGLLLQYGDHKGLPELRELIARDGVGPVDVLVTAGAAAALFLVATTLLEPGSHALVCRPNYATNVETPRAIGADVEYVDLRFEDGWRLDPERIAAGLRPDTRLVSVCVPHNPTGRTMDEAELRALAALVERHGTARLLVDETYREIAYDRPLPLAASLSDRAIGVSSLSKAYGLPGLRIGWITCRDPALAERLLAAKEQVLLAGSVLDETMAARVLARRDDVLPGLLATMRARRDAVPAGWATRPPSSGTRPRRASSASRACAPRPPPASRRSTRRSRRTAPTSGRATGSSRTGAISGSGSAGRVTRSSRAASRPRSRPRGGRSRGLMARRNRVTPLGELIADPARGLVYGNRGCLHDAAGRIRRSHAGRRWIACRLRFRGWHREPLLQPGRFTELFFLDEATAFAAGHRPCALCRRADYDRFLALTGAARRRRDRPAPARRAARRPRPAPPRGRRRGPARRRVRAARRRRAVARARRRAAALDAGGLRGSRRAAARRRHPADAAGARGGAARGLGRRRAAAAPERRLAAPLGVLGPLAVLAQADLEEDEGDGGDQPEGEGDEADHVAGDAVGERDRDEARDDQHGGGAEGEAAGAGSHGPRR